VRVRYVVAAGGLVIAIALVLVLSERGPRRSGSNRVPNGEFAVTLERGSSVCQPGETIPADTAAVEMTIGTYRAPGTPLQVHITGAQGGLISEGGLGHGWQQGVVAIPIRRVPANHTAATVCLRNTGSDALALAGVAPFGAGTIKINGRSVFGALRLDYLRPERGSYFSLLPTIADRVGYGKGSYTRDWAWIGVLVAVATVAVLVGRLLLRAERDAA
jgi:hypothetical protein